MRPVFSVIITAHDRTEYIDEAIDSVISQSIDPELYEVIIVTNFPYEKGESIFKRIICGDKGAGAKLALGIQHANGELIAPLDDDDLWEPERLERIHWVMARNQSIVYYHNSSLVIDESGRIMTNVEAEIVPNRLIEFSGDASLRSIRKMQSMRADWNSSSIVFRKNIVVSNVELLRRIERSPEALFFYSALLPRATIAVDSSALTRYRVHKSNTSTHKLVKSWENKRVVENFKHHLKDGILIEAKADEDCDGGKSRLKAARRNMLDDRIHLRIIDDKEGLGTIARDILRYLAVVKTAISFYDLALLTLGMTAVINQNLARSIYFSNFIT